MLQDLRYAVRMLLKAPSFTLIVMLTLALGIGANTAIFSVVNAVLLRPLPYDDPEKLVVILHNYKNAVAPANFTDWREQSHVFERMGAAEYWTANLTGTEVPEKLWALHVSSDIFPMLGVRPLIGRTFLPADEKAGEEHKAVLSYNLWQRKFTGDENVIGKTLRLDGELYNVIGVMPRGFKFAPFWATKAELWAPLNLGARATSRSGSSLRIFARMKPGVTLDQAKSEMAVISGRLEQQYPGTNRNVTVQSLKEKVVGDIRRPLLVLLTAVAFILLIACANVAHMLLARAAARQKEIAVRIALGAKRSRMVRQFLTESLLLSFLGGAAGLLLAIGAIKFLLLLSPSSIPRLETIGLDANVFIFIVGVSAFTGIAFGLVPALQASAPNLTETLKQSGWGAIGAVRNNRYRGMLVASEFALALVLLTGAGLMIRSFLAMQVVDPGFNPHNVLSAAISVTGSREAAPNLRPAYYQELLQNVRRMPGVESASAINHLPLAGDNWGWPFSVEGRPIPRPGEGPSATYRVTLPGYFHTMNIPMLSGRDISESDNVNSPGVVVINEFMAKQYWPGENAVGKRITLDDPQKNPAWVTVIGVVKNTMRSDWTEPAEEEMFIPYLQDKNYLEGNNSAFTYLTFVVRTTGDPSAMAATLQHQVLSLDKDVTVSEVQTMEEVTSHATAEPRFYLLLMGTFAVVALSLAAVGIYGVMSYSVSRRKHEIGVRMAIGAQRSDVMQLILRQGMTLVVIGLAVGLVAALACTKLMTKLLYGVKPNDPLTFVATALLLMSIALLANLIPALRATKVDPLLALRHE